MSQKRKERIIVFDIRIHVWTDFMQELLSSAVHACLKGLILHEHSKDRKTTFEISERILDAKTFNEIKK